ncbi:uncharacterized protein [Henckelia pumila]|uniref:uncharacterized protein n=1 Tax=Henckelia pumila TaxID=405737 RepID=UPI003C6E8416
MASIQDNAAAEVEHEIDEEDVKQEAPAEAPKPVKTVMDDEEAEVTAAEVAPYHEGKLEYSDDEDEEGETESPLMERSEDTPFYLGELEPATGLVEFDGDEDEDEK